MKKIVILGGGSAGTMLANKLAKHTRKNEISIKLIESSDKHYYQPGFLFVPFGIYNEGMNVKAQSKFIPSGVEFINARAETIVPEKKQIVLENSDKIDYDILVIATGTRIAPEEVEGLNGPGWRKNIFDFYTPDGSSALAKFMETWPGGKLVINIAEMPIKCPIAPLEFIFLADWWFTKKQMRDKVEIIFVTPLSGAFTRPIASRFLGSMIQKKKITIIPDFGIASVNSEKKRIVSYEGQETDYDLLVSIPTNKGADVIENSGIGDELNFVPTYKNTLCSKKFDTIFVMGDATDIPTSKAGAVAHYQLETIIENLFRRLDEKELLPSFDGHANCFIESGYGKGILIDFNYETEPLPGKFPVPTLGPLSLLKETRANHWGKLAFRWIYWYMLLKGVHIPLSSKMSMKGKYNTKFASAVQDA